MSDLSERSADTSVVEADAEEVRRKLEATREEIGTFMVGQETLIDEILVCLLCRGHALLEGVPGLGKTSLIRTIADVLDLHSRRIQFTPDLMPADIVGTNVLVQDDHGSQRIQFQKGPIFAQIVLADEINRATPKTQSALLEAMQEQCVTISGTSYDLEPPFIVLATQNPIEMEGTYPLPEAQMDRFFFKLSVSYPSKEHVRTILERTTGPGMTELRKQLNAGDIAKLQEFVRNVPVSDEVADYAIRLVFSTHPDSETAPERVARYVRYGSSPRGAQSMVLAGKVFALMAGRLHVSFSDIKRAAAPSLRHRLILNFEGEAEGLSADDIVAGLFEQIREVEK